MVLNKPSANVWRSDLAIRYFLNRLLKKPRTLWLVHSNHDQRKSKNDQSILFMIQSSLMRFIDSYFTNLW